MKSPLLIFALGAILAAVLCAGPVQAGEGSLAGRIAHRQAQWMPWHGNYYHAAWGMPVALVVPPTAEFQTHWGWGVGNTRITTIRHQFRRNWPGPGTYQRNMFRPTPPWPSDTDQYGVYYVRGPW